MADNKRLNGLTTIFLLLIILSLLSQNIALQTRYNTLKNNHNKLLNASKNDDIIILKQRILINHLNNTLKLQQVQIKGLKEDLADTQKSYDKCLLENRNLSDLISREGSYYEPTTAQLRQFLAQDRTDEKSFEDPFFVCTDYAYFLIRKMWVLKHWRAYAVEIDFSDQTAHTLVYVKTSNRGWVFVEPQTDRIIYGLHLDENYCTQALQESSENCKGDWRIVKIVTFTGGEAEEGSERRSWGWLPN